MFWEMDFLNPPLKIFLKICPKKFLIFPDVELLAPRLKHFLYFWKSNFLVLYFFYISKSNFTSSKNKKNHSEKMSYISGNGTFQTQAQKTSLYFRKKLAKPKKKIFHIFCLLRKNFSNIGIKEKFLIFSLIKEENFLNYNSFL